MLLVGWLVVEVVDGSRGGAGRSGELFGGGDGENEMMIMVIPKRRDQTACNVF